MAFHWNEQKNDILQKERGISFERIVVAIEEGNLLGILEHPNKDRYANQIVIIVEIDSYAICVPAIEEENGDFFLKTLFPSRKYTKRYKLDGKK